MAALLQFRFIPFSKLSKAKQLTTQWLLELATTKRLAFLAFYCVLDPEAIILSMLQGKFYNYMVVLFQFRFVPFIVIFYIVKIFLFSRRL